MSLSLQDVQRIAQLARIDLDADEALATLAQLNSIFVLIEKMRAIDTRAIEPLSTPLAAVAPVNLRMREDTVSEHDQREAYQRSAPAIEDGLYLVPRVIE